MDNELDEEFMNDLDDLEGSDEMEGEQKENEIIASDHSRLLNDEDFLNHMKKIN